MCFYSRNRLMNTNVSLEEFTAVHLPEMHLSLVEFSTREGRSQPGTTSWVLCWGRTKGFQGWREQSGSPNHTWLHRGSAGTTEGLRAARVFTCAGFVSTQGPPGDRGERGEPGDEGYQVNKMARVNIRTACLDGALPRVEAQIPSSQALVFVYSHVPPAPQP